MDEIYDDLIQSDIAKYEERIDALEVHINKLNIDIQMLCTKMLEMKETQKSLVTNISVLYKTAKSEIERKDRMIAQLRREKDEILFRKRNFSQNKRPPSPLPSIESKRSKFNNQKEDISGGYNDENTTIICKTSDDMDETKPREVIDKIEQNKVIRSSPRRGRDGQSITRSDREKEQQKKSKERSKENKTSTHIEKNEISTKNSKYREYSKITHNVRNKDVRKSPNYKNDERKASKSISDKERSKSKEVVAQREYTKENRKSPQTNRVIKTHRSTSHHRREHESTSSKSSNKIHIPHAAKSSTDLRSKLKQHSTHTSDKSGYNKRNVLQEQTKSYEKHSSRNKEKIDAERVQKSPKNNIIKSEIVSPSKIRLLKILKQVDMEEGELTDDESLIELKLNISDNSEPKMIVTKTEDSPKAKIEHCKVTNDDLDISKPKMSNTDAIKSNLIEEPEEKIFTENMEIKNATFDVKPESFVHEIMKNAGENIAVTKINEDNVVELHIHPKSCVTESNSIETEMLLAQLEQNTSLTDEVVQTSESEVCGNNDVRVQQNNENVNTSNSLDIVLTTDKITVTASPTNASLSSSMRRRRRAIVFIT